MKSKPDDRRDNVERIQNNIDNTVGKIEAAKEMMAVTDNDKMKEDLEQKNERREEALDGMRQEIRDEAMHQKKK